MSEKILESIEKLDQKLESLSQYIFVSNNSLQAQLNTSTTSITKYLVEVHRVLIQLDQQNRSLEERILKVEEKEQVDETVENNYLEIWNCGGNPFVQSDDKEKYENENEENFEYENEEKCDDENEENYKDEIEEECETEAEESHYTELNEFFDYFDRQNETRPKVHVYEDVFWDEGFGSSTSTLPPPSVAAPSSSNTSQSFFTDLLDINFSPSTTVGMTTSVATATTLTTCTPSSSTSSSTTTSPRTVENDDSSSTETELPSDTIAATSGEPPPSVSLETSVSTTSPPPLPSTNKTTTTSPGDSPNKTNTLESKSIDTVKASWVDPTSESFFELSDKPEDEGTVSMNAWVNPESPESVSSAWGDIPSSTSSDPFTAPISNAGSPSPRPSPVSSVDGRTVKEVREELLSVSETTPPVVPRRQVSTSKTGGNVTAATILPQNLAPGERVIPIAVAFVETVNSVFKGSDEKSTLTKVTGDMTISFPANVVPALSSTSPQAPSLSFLVSGTTSLEQIFPNKQLVERSGQLPGGEGMLFKFNMAALAAYLKKQTEQGSKAAYYNIDILKYQVRCEGHKTAPLQMSSYWRCDPRQTDLIIEYTYNSSCMATPVALTNVSVVAPVDGGVEIMQSKPSAIWSGEQQRCTWKIASVSSNAEKSGALRARFDVTRGPTTPVPIAVQLTGEGSTISSLNFDLTSPSYKLSLVKKRFISGRYLVETS